MGSAASAGARLWRVPPPRPRPRAAPSPWRCRRAAGGGPRTPRQQGDGGGQGAASEGCRALNREPTSGGRVERPRRSRRCSRMTRARALRRGCSCAARPKGMSSAPACHLSHRLGSPSAPGSARSRPVFLRTIALQPPPPLPCRNLARL